MLGVPADQWRGGQVAKDPTGVNGATRPDSARNSRSRRDDTQCGSAPADPSIVSMRRPFPYAWLFGGQVPFAALWLAVILDSPGIRPLRALALVVGVLVAVLSVGSLVYQIHKRSLIDLTSSAT